MCVRNSSDYIGHPSLVPLPHVPIPTLAMRVLSQHLPNSQRSPKKPGGHWQRVALAPRHLPPLRHSHSSGVPARERLVEPCAVLPTCAASCPRTHLPCSAGPGSLQGTRTCSLAPHPHRCPRSGTGWTGRHPALGGFLYKGAQSVGRDSTGHTACWGSHGRAPGA